jgi:hypothetical protein
MLTAPAGATAYSAPAINEPSHSGESQADDSDREDSEDLFLNRLSHSGCIAAGRTALLRTSLRPSDLTDRLDFAAASRSGPEALMVSSGPGPPGPSRESPTQSLFGLPCPFRTCQRLGSSWLGQTAALEVPFSDTAPLPSESIYPWGCNTAVHPVPLMLGLNLT